jgi:hypothetical protein
MDAIVILKVIASLIGLGMIFAAVTVCVVIGVAIVIWPIEWARCKLFPVKSDDR